MEYCLDCGSKLRGRMDKKFCNDNCRSHHNNILNKEKHLELKKINTILKKNESILKKLNQNGVKKLTTAVLIAEGFDFNFFTHQLTGRNGELFNYCYNYGYLLLNEEEICLTQP